MEQKQELNTEELKRLIQYKGTQILAIQTKSTMNFEVNIDDILNENNTSINKIKKDIESDGVELPPKKYTIKDILEHPENQGVIRMFIFVFIAMIVIPIGSCIFLKYNVMPYILMDWSKEGKENILLVIGVAIAHIIGLMYVCYAWSGEDAEPDHIRDAREEKERKEIEDDDDDEYEDETEEEEEEESEEINEEQKEEIKNDQDERPKISPSSSSDKREYLFIEREERESTTKDVINDKGGQNIMRQRKTGKNNE